MKFRILNISNILNLWICLLSAFSLQASSLEFPDSKLKIKEGKVLFRSITSQEEIYGTGNTVSGEFDPSSNTVSVQIDMRDFKTGNKLRDAHMHDNYLESESFPKAIFAGKILSYDPKSGKAKISGSLTLHGIQKNEFTMEGILFHDGERLGFTSSFFILLGDFQIEIPKLLLLKLNEKIEIKTDIRLEKTK